MTDTKTIRTSITAPTQGYVIACCIGLIDRVWSTEQQERIVRTLMAYYGVTR